MVVWLEKAALNHSGVEAESKVVTMPTKVRVAFIT